MLHVVILLIAALSAQAAVVKGTVRERASGHALSHVQMRLTPVPRPGTRTVVPPPVFSGHTGEFAFTGIPAGLYLLTAERDFYSMGRPPVPFELSADSEFGTDLLMHKRGVITGRVVDLYGVGLGKVPVVAYRARLPLKEVSRGVADPTGVFRIGNLDPGRYWVRNAEYLVDDGMTLIPTFAPKSRDSRDAEVFIARLDQEIETGSFQPISSNISRLTVQPIPRCPAPQRMKVILLNEAARHESAATCPASVEFPRIVSGRYDVLTIFGKDESAVFMPDVQLFSRTLTVPPPTPLPTVKFQASTAVRLTGHRLYDYSASETLFDPQGTVVHPGKWEFTAVVPPGMYVQSILPSSASPITRDTTVQIVVSDKPGRISGRVIKEGKPVPGAPVFLLPGYRQAITNTEGAYEFADLAPGDYRLLSSFDFLDVEDTVVERAQAPSVKVAPSVTTAQELTVWEDR